jgi:septum formation protein
MPSLILASTSPYRRQLLSRLGLAFDCARPQVDEQPHADEAPIDLAMRLAQEKAQEVTARHPGHWVIGSDQVADLAGQPLGKPGTVEAARAQLAAMSARHVDFHTAICITDGQTVLRHCDLTRVRFRALDSAQIARYIAAEQPLDCAGSFKCEGLGIALFEAIENRDPTALIGLPLIATSALLRQAGFSVP